MARGIVGDSDPAIPLANMSPTEFSEMLMSNRLPKGPCGLD